MTFSDFVHVFFSNPEFQTNYEELPGEANPQSQFRGPAEIQWIIDQMAISLDDIQFENVFKSVVNDVPQVERKNFFDNFYQTITWDGYNTKLKTESAEWKDRGWDPEFHVMFLESGKRITWLCNWVEINYSSEKPGRQEFFKLAADEATWIVQNGNLVTSNQATIFRELLLRNAVDEKVEIEGELGVFCSFIAHLSRKGLIKVQEEKLREFLIKNFTKNGKELVRASVYKAVEPSSGRHKTIAEIKASLLDSANAEKEMEIVLERLFGLNSANYL